MIDELNKSLEIYEQQWQKLISVRYDRAFFAGLQPTAVAWKVSDRAEFDDRFKSLQDNCDQIHLAWINERWLATLHLRNEKLANGVEVVKLMQRRPGSEDAVGLDHIDFFISEGPDAKSILSSEDNLDWSEEMNGDYCKWLSVWFEGTEAKLRRDTVLRPCIDELSEVQQKILDGTA